VTGTGPSSVGLFAENLNAGNGGNITVTATGGVSGTQHGIEALTKGNGNIAIEGGGAITSAVQFGIRAQTSGSGSLSVVTDAGTTINSGGAGISLVNYDTAISGAASTIIVMANGTINSGTTLNPNGSQPQGIAAGYYGAPSGGSAAANTSVNGTVVVNNNANITAAAGYGIDAYNYGNGDVTVNDGAGTLVTGPQYGIAAYGLSQSADGSTRGTGNVAVTVGSSATVTATTAFASGTYGVLAYSNEVGNVAVTTSQGATINSAGTGIDANNGSMSIPSSGAMITVTNNAAINSGTGAAGTTTYGILAGFSANNGNPGAPNLNVNGTVLVKNYGNITALGAYGIDAFNYGNGDVTLDEGSGTSTSVSGAQYGVGAFGLSKGSDNVTVDVAANATLSGGSFFGIWALSNEVGNINLTTADGDIINGGSIGINVQNQTTSEPVGGSIKVVIGNDTINSGTLNTPSGSATPGAISVGYAPNGANTPAANVHGDVSLESNATITAAKGAGINAYNWGTGSVSVTTDAASAITAPGNGIQAYALNGGSVSISNAGTISAATGIFAQTVGGGSVTVNNSGMIETNPASQALIEQGGDITLNNTGTIDGRLNLGNASFNNKPGGLWQVAGLSSFGFQSTTGVSEASTINNAGTIDLSGAVFTSAYGLVVNNTGTIDNLSGASVINGAVNNGGTIEVIGGSLDLEGVLSGAGGIALSAGAALTLGGATSAGPIAVSGNGSLLTVSASGDLISLNGDGNTLAVSGSNNTITITADAGVVTLSDMTGTTDMVTVNANGSATTNIAGAGDIVTVNNNSWFGNNVVDVAGTNDQVIVNSNDVYAYSDLVTVSGTGDTVTINSQNYNPGNPVSVTGTNDTVTVNYYSYSDPVTISGNNDVVTVVRQWGGGTSTVNISGTNDTVVLTDGGDTVTLAADNASLNLTVDGAAISVTGANDTLSLTGNNDTLNVSGSNDVVTVTGSNDIINLSGANDQVTLVGGETIATPTISGTAQEGKTLAASITSSGPLSYQWMSSTDGGTTWSNISGATSSTYLVQELDEGAQIKVIESASDSNGNSVSATSAATAPVIDAVPTITTPTISGNAQVGQILTAAVHPTSITYDLNLTVGTGTIRGWIQTDGHVGALSQADITNADVILTDGTQSYTVTGAQPFNSFGSDLTATTNGLFFNFGGSGGGFGTPTFAFEDTSGSISAHPSTISLNIPGDPLSPMWTAPLSGDVQIAGAENPVSYQWMSSTDGGTTWNSIPGATSSTYLVQQSDEGAELEVVATATNDNGVSVSATSAETTAVTLQSTASLTINPIDGNNFITATNLANGITINGITTGNFAGQTVTVALNNKTYTTTVTSGGTWSVIVGTADLQNLVSGDVYPVTVSATDAYGHAVSSTDNVSVNTSSNTLVFLTTGADNLIGVPDGTTVVGTSSTLNSNDQLVGGGDDILTLLGSGTFDLTSLAQFSGFTEVQATGSNFALTLPSGENINVDTSLAGNGTINLGSGSSTVTISDSQTLNFTNGNDTVTGSGNNSAFNLSSATANISLSGGNGSNFNLGSGSAIISLDGALEYDVFNLGSGSATITVDGNLLYESQFTLGSGNANITIGGYVEYDTFNLSSALFDIDASAAGGYYSFFNSNSYSNFQAGDVIKASTNTSTNYLDLNGTDGTYDLSSSTIQNIANLSLASGVSVNGNGVGEFATISGAGTIIYSGATADLSNTSVGQGVEIESTNTSGTTFLVKDVQTALDILPGTAPNTIEAEGFTFTAQQRNLLFDQGNAVVEDSTGVYGSPALNQTLLLSGNETLITNGAKDTLVANSGFGLDTITDFDTSKDVIQFNPALFASYTAVMGAASQVGANTVIQYDANDTITLNNVTASSLTQNNFHFS
jgi:hypothetical protein